jgi:hypothetical protein
MGGLLFVACDTDTLPLVGAFEAVLDREVLEAFFRRGSSEDATNRVGLAKDEVEAFLRSCSDDDTGRSCD